jgi:hypothetical protein
MFEPQLRRLRLRQKTSAWASNGPAVAIDRHKREINDFARSKKSRLGPPVALPGADVWRHAWGDGAHCPCVARLAANRTIVYAVNRHKRKANDFACGRKSRPDPPAALSGEDVWRHASNIFTKRSVDGRS